MRSTALHGLVLDHRATFEQVAADEGGVPRFVSKGFENFLRCGVLAHGFARFGCKSCRYEHLVLSFTRFDGQSDYAANPASRFFNSNSMGLA